MHQRNLIEAALEQALFKSRWLLAPFYLGLVVSLAMLLAAFAAELIHALPNALLPVITLSGLTTCQLPSNWF